MQTISDVFENIGLVYNSSPISTITILTILAVVTILSIYEFAVYRLISHRSFYNKSFNIAITILPYFISTIILCLQSNVVITLGTIGALAIIRFRTAVKDPVDMIYLLWSIHTGIICGCQLFPVAIITSVLVTILLLVLEHVHFGRKPYVVIVHSHEQIDKKLAIIFKKHARSFRIKSRNFTSDGVDYAIEASIKKPELLTHKLRNTKKVVRFSVIEYDADDLV